MRVSFLVLAVLIVAGCGGGGGSNVSKADYIAQADKICRTERNAARADLVKQAQELQKDGKLDDSDLIELQASGYKTARRVLDRLEKMERPSEGKADLDRYFDTNEKIMDAGTKLVEAGRGGDMSKAAQYAQQTRDLSKDAVDAAKKFGFQECGTELQQTG